MKVKKKICDGSCGRLSVIWKNHEGKRYCKACWSAHSKNFQPIPKQRKRIPARSSKRIKEEEEYSRERKLFLEAHPLCKMALPGICTYHSTDVHHRDGRIGSNYLDKTKWIPGCRACHVWIHNNPKSARELGLLI